MPKKDINQLAKFLVDQATCELPTPKEKKNNSVASLGKLGKKETAATFTGEQRSEIAKKPRKPRA